MNHLSKIYWFKISFFILAMFIFSSLLKFQINVSKKATDENFFSLIDNKVVVTAVFKDGASDRAGMKIGDIITHIDNQVLINEIKADSILRSKIPGSTMKYDILRDGEKMSLYVTAASQAFKFYNFFAIINCLGMLVIAIIAINKAHLSLKVIIYATSLILSSIPIVYFLSQPFLFQSQLHIDLFNAGIFLGVPMIFHSLLLTPRNIRLGKLTKRLIFLAYTSGAIIFIMAVIPGLLPQEILKKYLVYKNSLQIINSIAFISFIFSLSAFNITGNYKSDFFKREVVLLYSSWVLCIISIFLYMNFLFQGSDNRLFFILPIFLPLFFNAYYFIKKRFFNIDVVVNRSVKYQILNFLSMFILVSIFLVSITAITKIDLNNYSFNLSYTGLEISDKPIQGFSDRPVFILFGVISLIAYLFIYRYISKWINIKFSRDEYNYKNALSDIHAIQTGKDFDENVFDKVVIEIQRIMRIKGVALLIEEDDKFSIKSIQGFTLDFREDLIEMEFPDNLFGFEETTIIANHPIRNIFSLSEIQLIVPLSIDGNVLGYFLLGEKKSEDVFNQSDIEFIESVSTQVMTILENNRLTLKAVETEKIHHELKIAKKLQMNLLPKEIPESSKLDISTYYISAKEVGGDYYDILKNDDDDLLFVLGDVSGKGITASLYMSRFQGIMRSLVQTGVDSTKELLVKTNEIVHHDIDKNSFVTCLCVNIDASGKSLSFSRAGHLPLFHYKSSSREVISHEPNGIALGMMSTKIFQNLLVEDSLEIEKGDIFVICSDGVTEAMNSNKDEYGFERLTDLIKTNVKKSADELLDIIVKDINKFVANSEPSDDIAIILIKVIK